MNKQDITISVPSTPPPSYTAENQSLTRLAIKTILFTFGFVIILFSISTVVAGFFLNHKLNQFLSTAGIEREKFFQTIEIGLSTTPQQTDGRVNILLLGTDELENRADSVILTDTLLLVSLDLDDNTAYTLPLPRDLWSEEYQTKINALYHYGAERSPESPENFPQEVISEMIGLPIHHTLVLKLSDVSEIIDMLDGIDVAVENGFTDEQFPRSDVDITTVTDPKLLYETVTFVDGQQHMDGQTALKYIRSRHSEGDEGTDNARSQRQQQVVSALITKLTSREILLNPTQLGHLYAFYLKNYDRNLSMTQVVAISKRILEKETLPSLENKILTIYPDDENGLITHPHPAQYDNQWVYTRRDPENFRLELNKIIGIDQE